MVNEGKWIIHALSEQKSDVPAIRERGGLRIMLCTFWALVLVAIVASCQDIVEMDKQPLYTQPFEGKYRFVALMGVATWLSAALASLLLL